MLKESWRGHFADGGAKRRKRGGLVNTLGIGGPRLCYGGRDLGLDYAEYAVGGLPVGDTVAGLPLGD